MTDARLGRGLAMLATLVLVSVLASACRATIRADDVVAREDAIAAGSSAAAFFRAPLLSHVSLSPDGRNLAAIFAKDGIETLVVRRVSGGEIRPLAKLERRSFRTSMSVRRVGWPSDERVLVSIEMPSTAAIGVRARQTRLMVVDVERGSVRYLGEDWPHQQYSQSQDDIVSWLPDDPDSVLVSLWLPGENGAGVRRLNVHTGRLKTIVRPRRGSRGWAADHLGIVRAGWGEPRDSLERLTYARRWETEGFEQLIRWNPFEEAGFEFAAFSEDPVRIYVYSDAATGRRAVYAYDLNEQEMGALVFGHAEVDVHGLRSSKRDGRLLAVEYVTDEPRVHYVDAEARAEGLVLDHGLPGLTRRIVSSDASDRRIVLEVSSDVQPPRYYVYDRPTKHLALLVAAFPELEGREFAPMQPVQYEARDGLVIHGFLTRPPSAPSGPLPTIVYPHGGPWARDAWGWDPVVQFLVSHGFAVFQLNFRGSDGYGADFRQRGTGEWGGKMQDDVTDGTRWLVEQGIADPRRIGIFGASYGGYAALWGLIKTPELFRAGASFAGVTDLPTLLSDDQAYSFGEEIQELVGHRWKDREYLRSVSPARNADAVQAPVLIGHGTEDWRVHVKQAEAMADALEAAGVEVETHLYDGEVHGFLDERNRIDFYTKLAAFFERNLNADPIQ